MNFLGILLRLSQPIAAKPQLKVLIADPTYQAVTMDQRIAKEVHMINVDKETCLLPEGIISYYYYFYALRFIRVLFWLFGFFQTKYFISNKK